MSISTLIVFWWCHRWNSRVLSGATTRTLGCWAVPPPSPAVPPPDTSGSRRCHRLNYFSSLVGLQTWPKSVRTRAQLAPNRVIGLTLNPNPNYMQTTKLRHSPKQIFNRQCRVSFRRAFRRSSGGFPKHPRISSGGLPAGSRSCGMFSESLASR